MKTILIWQFSTVFNCFQPCKHVRKHSFASGNTQQTIQLTLCIIFVIWINEQVTRLSLNEMKILTWQTEKNKTWNDGCHNCLNTPFFHCQCEEIESFFYYFTCSSVGIVSFWPLGLGLTWWEWLPLTHLRYLSPGSSFEPSMNRGRVSSLGVWVL